MKKWFRLYVEVLNDPKVQRLPPQLFKDWINLLCLAAEHDGKIPASIEDVAFTLRISEPRAEKIIDDLRQAGLLDVSETTISPHGWDRRQYKSDISSERVDKYRSKIRDNGCSPGGADKFRQAVYERDQYACVYCGDNGNLCLDHIVPVALGGITALDNLATSCKRCNSGKAGRTPTQAGYKAHRNPDLVTVAVGKYLSQPVTVTETPSDTDTEYIPPKGPQGGRVVGDLFGCLEPAGEPTTVTSPMEARLEATVQSLYARHIVHPDRTSTGPAEIRKLLKAIIRKQRTVPEKVAILEQIDANHAASWATFAWQKEGGKYAKALSTWLSPTIGRYLDPPKPQEVIPEPEDYTQPWKSQELLS